MRHHLCMKSDHDPDCYKCAERMSSADIDAEFPMGDCLCISCRSHVEQCKEEDATASFCAPLRNPVADWYMAVVVGSGFTFAKTSTTGDLCYINGPLLLACVAEGRTIRLIRINKLTPSQPDWGITFDLSTPAPVILATIKAAVEHESK